MPHEVGDGLLNRARFTPGQPEKGENQRIEGIAVSRPQLVKNRTGVPCVKALEQARKIIRTRPEQIRTGHRNSLHEVDVRVDDSLGTGQLARPEFHIQSRESGVQYCLK